MRDLVEIQALLHAYRDFSECIVEEIAIQEFGAVATISLDYVWLTDGSVRPDEDERLIVDLDFRGLRQFSLRNGGTRGRNQNEAVAGWSDAEVSLIRVVEAKSESFYPSSITLHRAVVRREGEDWIEVVFSELNIAERKLSGS